MLENLVRPGRAECFTHNWDGVEVSSSDRVPACLTLSVGQVGGSSNDSVRC